MNNYLLLNLSELAMKRAVNMRDEAQLWDILSRDLKREAKRREEAEATKPVRTRALPPPPESEPADDRKLYVRIPEAARMMGIGKSSLYREISLNRMKVRKAGRKTLIAVADIRAWFEALPEGMDR